MNFDELNSRGYKLITIAESKFGNRVPNLFNGFRYKIGSEYAPQLIGNQEIGYTIILSQYTGKLSSTVYECSHEIFHLLMPTTFSNVSVFEEGLATFFSIEILRLEFDDIEIKEQLDFLEQTYPKYYLPYTYITSLNTDVSLLIRRIRSDYPTTLLSDLTHAQLQNYSELSNDLIQHLIKKFNSSK